MKGEESGNRFEEEKEEEGRIEERLELIGEIFLVVGWIKSSTVYRYFACHEYINIYRSRIDMHGSVATVSRVISTLKGEVAGI